MPDGALAVNEDGVVAWTNLVAREMLGLQKNHDASYRLTGILPDAPSIQSLGKSNQVTVELESPNRAGGRFELYGVPYGESQYLVLLKDVTQVVELANLRRNFIANASHELRTPFTVIVGYLEGLPEDEAITRNWGAPEEEMKRQSVRMMELVDDLLRLSKLENSGAAVARRPLDMSGLIGLARKEALSGKGAEHSIEISFESQDQLFGEEWEIDSVLTNLTNNAVSYSPKEKPIHIRRWTSESGGWFSGQDLGAGFDAKHIPFLTQHFYRVDIAHSRREGGTGLGLAIVKHALDRHGARLEINSELNKGRTFTCHFPQHRVLPTDLHPKASD